MPSAMRSPSPVTIRAISPVIKRLVILSMTTVLAAVIKMPCSTASMCPNTSPPMRMMNPSMKMVMLPMDKWGIFFRRLRMRKSVPPVEEPRQ